MSDNPTLKMQRKYALGLGQWLNSLALIGRESRERTKFVELLSEEVKENEAMRLEVIKKFAEKDDKGEPVIVEGDENKAAHFAVPDDKLADFNKEMLAYLDEEFVISGEGLKNRLMIVKSIVLNTTEKIEPNIASEYDKWCEAFEKMEI